MADFQSLLGTFQAATGNNASRPNKKQKKESLKELTTRLWQTTQIQSGLRMQRKNKKTASRMQPSDASNAPPAHHLAVCLCVVDDLIHQEIWRYWMEHPTTPSSSAEIFVHAKFPDRVRGEFCRSKLIPQSFQPNWNDIRVVQALLALIEHALAGGSSNQNDNKDKQQQKRRPTHILIGTESCLPVALLGNVPLSPGKSYIRYYDRSGATRFEERDVWDVVSQQVPLECIHKALPGWCVLAAEHAQEILDMPEKHLASQELWPAFKDCWAPEEVYFATCLSLLGKLQQQEHGGTVQQSLVHAEWDHRARNHADRAHPLEFRASSLSTVEFWNPILRRSPHLIAIRKVKERISVSEWMEQIVPAAATAAAAQQRLRSGEEHTSQQHSNET